MLPQEFKGILAPTKNSVLSEASQRIVFFADPDKEQYPKTDILQSKSVNLAHNFQEIKTSLCVVYKKGETISSCCASHFVIVSIK